MKRTKDFKLVEGTYSSEESMEILMNLFNSKINFHELKIFSAMERRGIDDKFSKKRINELNKCIKEIAAFVKKAEKNKQNIVIQSIVNLSVE
jgi:hypothetical protein